jgi:2'-5' RNA ligase
MLTTSHFIGLEIRSTALSDLFFELQGFFRANNILDDLELQNPLSTHLTLYYLDSELSESDNDQICTLIKDVAQDDIQLSGLKTEYFGEVGNERVCYIGCEPNDALFGLNQEFAQKLSHTQVEENSLAFVAHISLFRIRKPEHFAQFRGGIEQIINKFLAQLDGSQITGDIALYAVNSKYCPEIQIKLT